jgi:hypothetical protein
MRICNILLLCVYTIANVGVYANTHYCGGVITHLGLFENADEQDQCECAAMKQTDCCDDVQVKANVKSESVISPVLQSNLVFKIIKVLYSNHSAFTQNLGTKSIQKIFIHKWRCALPNFSLLGTTTTILRF